MPNERCVQAVEMRVPLPHGVFAFVPVAREPGHFLWLDLLGWHDCTLREDAIVNARILERRHSCMNEFSSAPA